MTDKSPTPRPEAGIDPVSRRNLLGLATAAGAAGLTLPVLGVGAAEAGVGGAPHPASLRDWTTLCR